MIKGERVSNIHLFSLLISMESKHHSVFQLSRHSSTSDQDLEVEQKQFEAAKRYTPYNKSLSITVDLQTKKWRRLLKTCSVSEES